MRIQDAGGYYSTWGATRDDLLAVLPGDSLISEAHYRIDHVISIHAPAAAVWPWLVQIGQDRGGFYSYDWLESAIGSDIHNAQRIVLEWQHRRPGDLVRAVPPDWMGGRFGREIGWRVLQVVPGRALVLQGWGAFVLHPVDSATTRLHVRTRDDGRPILAGEFLAPTRPHGARAGTLRHGAPDASRFQGSRRTGLTYAR